jgi:hypothetical protein
MGTSVARREGMNRRAAQGLLSFHLLAALALSSTTAHARTAWEGVAAARQHDFVAAWKGSTLALSRDGGKTFRRQAEGSEHVARASFDDEGTLFVLRGAHSLSVVSRRGEAREARLDFARTTTELVGGAGALAWIGTREGDANHQPTLALSRDAGATWTFPEVDLGSLENHLAIDADGTLRLLVEDEADCGGGHQAILVGKVAGGGFREPGWPLDAPGTATLGDGGWSYALGACGESDAGAHLCAVDPDGEPMAALPAAHATFGTFHAVTDGRETWATLDGRLAWLSRDAVIFPARHTPKGFVLDAVDAEGRPVGVARGRVVRFRRDGKWETLLAAR